MFVVLIATSILFVIFVLFLLHGILSRVFFSLRAIAGSAAELRGILLKKLKAKILYIKKKGNKETH